MAGRVVSFGVDVGGTLAKVVYYEPTDPASEEQRELRDRINAFLLSSLSYGKTGQRDERFQHYSQHLAGTFHFIKFQTARIDEFVDIVRRERLLENSTRVYSTGGGALKFHDMLKRDLDVELVRFDELECLVRGISVAIQHFPNECYYLKNPDFKMKMEKTPFTIHDAEYVYPYLVVNIGSGVSILKVESENSFTRVGGTSLGGGTFYGLCKKLTGVESYAEILEMAECGDSTKVDMLVRDIYGGDYERLGLAGSVVASSFGKLATEKDNASSSADFIKAALITITNNIGSLVMLHTRIHQAKVVMFVGNFLANNWLAMRTLAYAMDFWSGSEVKAVFLEHEGYFGALGALVHIVTHAPPPTSDVVQKVHLAAWSDELERPRRYSVATTTALERDVAAAGSTAAGSAAAKRAQSTARPCGGEGKEAPVKTRAGSQFSPPIKVWSGDRIERGGGTHRMKAAATAAAGQGLTIEPVPCAPAAPPATSGLGREMAGAGAQVPAATAAAEEATEDFDIDIGELSLQSGSCPII